MYVVVYVRSSRYYTAGTYRWNVIVCMHGWEESEYDTAEEAEASIPRRAREIVGHPEESCRWCVMGLEDAAEIGALFPSALGE